MTRAGVGLAAVLLLAAATNPSVERHKDAIKAAFAAQGPLLGAIAGEFASLGVRYTSRGVFSYTTLDGKLASWGAFGLVHAVPPKD